MTSSRHPMWARRAFDGGVVLGGLTVLCLAASFWIHQATAVHGPSVVAAVLVVVMTQFPLVLPQRSGDAVIGFEASALVFLALTTSPGEALVLWAASQVVAQLVVDRDVLDRLFNIGITSLSGGALVGIVRLGRGVGRDNPGELGIALAACAAYFLIDLLVTSMSLSIEVGNGTRGIVRWRGVPLPLVCFVGIDSLGYLGAILDRHEPRWTLALLLVPIGTILVAVRSINQSHLSQGRLTRLFAAAAESPDWGDAVETERLLVEQATRVLRHTQAALLDRPAVGLEISVPLDLRGLPLRHLVVWHVGNTAKFDDDDKHALETLVNVVAASINRRRLADEMTHMARHDPLTGLANRRVFTDRLDHALELRPGGHPVAILYCDLDGFKSVNDRSGHEVGDVVLKSVAERILSCLRPGDTAARLGGDEFGVLLEQSTPGGAEAVADRLLAAGSAPALLAGREVTISVSIGIAYVTTELKAGDVLRHADTAMYRAKALGKNRAELFQPSMQSDNLRRLRLEDELRQAVRDRAFTVAYQPVIDLSTNTLEGFEALARWAHPELGEIPPDVFIPLAEHLGLIRDIGLQMLEDSYVGGAALQRALGKQLSLAVNISPLQARDPLLLDKVKECLSGHPQIALMLELTELAMLSDDVSTVRALEALVTAGARLAVDDFGTGYSSISYLNRLPVTVLKIDRSFTRDLGSRKSLPLVEGVIAMAKTMGLRIVAEGIEDDTAARLLRAGGCDYGQGFYFSAALPLAQALVLIESGRFSPGAFDDRDHASDNVPDNVLLLRSRS